MWNKMGNEKLRRRRNETEIMKMKIKKYIKRKIRMKYKDLNKEDI